MMIRYLGKKSLALAGLVAPLAAFATLGANPAQAAFIGSGPGLFSFDGTLAITVNLLAGGGFTTTVDFGNNGFGIDDTQTVDLAKADELAANGTGAFASFLGDTVTIKDLSYTVPAVPGPSIPVVLPSFLDLNPSTGVGGVPGGDTFDLASVSAPTFTRIPTSGSPLFGTVLAIGGGGVFNSSNNPPNSQPGVGLRHVWPTLYVVSDCRAIYHGYRRR
jgi:hypothetical protein